MTRSVEKIQKDIQRISKAKEDAIRDKIKNEAALEQVKDEARGLKVECEDLGIKPKDIKKEISTVTEKLNKALDAASEIVEQLENLEVEQEEEEDL